MIRNKDEVLKIAIPFIEKLEGCILQVYRDEVGIPTIGYGHKLINNEIRNRVTLQEANSLLASDLRVFLECLEMNLKAGLNKNQIASLLSFVFNIGSKAFENSTMLKLLNDNQITEASNEFDRWIYVTKNNEKIVSNNLKQRRATEKALFLKEVF